tara:strand:+ start:63 stop:482 length:420 start_codon:yes stop_codon:yes gene_type:complete
MSKKKRKLKKLLKGAALVGAAALGAGALNKRRQMKEFLKTEGGNMSILPKAKRFVNVQGKMAFPVDVDALPFEISQRVKDYGFDTNRKDLGVPMPRFNPAMAGSSGLMEGDFAAKDGGRARKTKFSKNKKKQANRSRKK